MPATDVAALAEGIRRYWPATPGEKTRRYLGQFFEQVRIGKQPWTNVEGNQGMYAVSTAVKGSSVEAACSCDMGAEGGYQHCHPLAPTFLQQRERFYKEKPQPVKQVRTLPICGPRCKGSRLKEEHGRTKRARR